MNEFNVVIKGTQGTAFMSNGEQVEFYCTVEPADRYKFIAYYNDYDRCHNSAYRRNYVYIMEADLNQIPFCWVKP